MNSVSLAAPLAAPPNVLSLLAALPHESWMWVALAVVVLAVAARLTRQRTPITTLDTHVADTSVEVQR
ncbi:hypothetical protein [Nocardiopsis eucommiae]|uniref:hypothetical protein n=1 Tax=Nocardiopsis eucommiae TaxID=2831970 RepID=UPI003D717A13